MSDLQDVISRLERVIQTGATDKDGKHPISAEFVLEELKSIADRPQGEWIPCSERLPSNSEKPNNSTCSKMEQVEDDPQTERSE